MVIFPATGQPNGNITEKRGVRLHVFLCSAARSHPAGQLFDGRGFIIFLTLSAHCCYKKQHGFLFPLYNLRTKAASRACDIVRCVPALSKGPPTIPDLLSLLHRLTRLLKKQTLPFYCTHNKHLIIPLLPLFMMVMEMIVVVVIITIIVAVVIIIVVIHRFPPSLISRLTSVDVKQNRLLTFDFLRMKLFPCALYIYIYILISC